jgi:hypothetical protein
MPPVFCSKNFRGSIRGLMYQILFDRNGLEVGNILEEPMVLIVTTEHSWTKFTDGLGLMKYTSSRSRDPADDFWKETMKSVLIQRRAVHQVMHQLYGKELSPEILQLLMAWHTPREVMCMVISDLKPGQSSGTVSIAKKEEDVQSALCFTLPVNNIAPDALIQSGVSCLDMKCDACRKGHCKLRMCARCYSVSYCSEVCQRAHWTAGHKVTCRHREASEACFV